jgi:predicted phage terminase large subunit-like protein
MCRDGMIWNVLNIPAKCKHLDDPLGRRIGEYLWPEWFDAKHWYQYEPRPGDNNSPSERRWSSLYQQEPRPETGNEFEEAWVQWYPLGQHPKHLMLYSASDYAVTDPSDSDDPDFSEHGIGGLDENAHLWIVDWYFAQRTTNYTIAALLALGKKWNVRQGFGEMGIIRRAIEAQWEMQQRETGYYMMIDYLPHIGDKIAKFADAKALGAAGKIHIPDCPWGRRLVQQLCVFPSPGKKDDAVDVLSLMARGTKNMVWSKERVTAAPAKGIVWGSWEWLTYNDDKHKEKPHFI